jgi:fibronectin-binding autotransporter adhesin
LVAGRFFAIQLRTFGPAMPSARVPFLPLASVRPLPCGKILPALVAVFLAALAPARGQVITAIASGNWSDGAIWSGGVVPGAANTASLSAVTLTLGSSATVGALTGAADSTVTLASGVTLTTGGNHTSTTYAGAISGAGGLNKTGSGTFTLSGANTHTGSTTISGGTLALGSSGALGATGTISFGGGTLQFSANNTTDYSGRFSNAAGQARSLDTNGQNVTFATALTGTGSALTKLGPGTLSLTGNNTYTGTTTVDGGVLALADSGTTLTAAGALYVGYNATGAVSVTAGTVSVSTAHIGFRPGSSGAVTVSGGILGTGDILEVGSANTSSATLLLSGGAIRDNAALLSVNATANATVTVSGGTWTNTGSFYIGLEGPAVFTMTGGTVSSGNEIYIGRNGVANGAATVSGGVLSAPNRLAIGYSSTGSLTVADSGSVSAGTVQLAFNSAGTGTLNLNGGTLSTGQISENIGTGGGHINLNGGTLRATASQADFISGFEAGDVQLLSGGAVLDTQTFAIGIAAGLQGAGGLTKQGTGTLTLSGANTFTGATTISAGTLVLTGGAALANSGAIVLDASDATLSVVTSETIGSLAGVAGSTVTLSSGATLTTGGNHASTTFSGIISGAGALTKTGAGTFTLSGVNTYTGPTTISAGTLSVATLDFGGAASGLGASSNAAANLVLDGGALRYTGGFTLTDRLLTLGLQGGTLDASGSGELIFSLSSPIVLTGTNSMRTLTLSGTGSSYLGLSLGDNGTGATTLVKTGSGTWRLNNTNTYTGPTIVSAGTLSVGGGTPINSSDVSLTSAGAVLEVLGGGSLTIGSLAGVAGSTVTLAASIVLNVGGSNASTTFAGSIQGAGLPGLAKAGTGTFTLSGANTYAGGTTVSAGTLSVATLANGGVASGVGASGNAAANLVLDGGALLYTGAAASTDRLFTVGANGAALDASGTGTLIFSNGASLALSGTNTARTLTLAGTGDGSFRPNLGDNGTGATSLVKSGTGTWTLFGANTYTGPTTISAGTLAYGVNNALSASTSVTVAAGAALDLAGSNGSIGYLSGAGSVNLGAGMLTVNSTASVSNIIIIFSGGSGSGGVVILGGGTLNFGGGLGGTNSGGTSGSVTISAPVSFSGVISGTGGLTINGPGLPVPASSGSSITIAGSLFDTFSPLPIMLSGDNTYAGGTILNGGTLSLGSAGALGTTGTISFGGGTLRFGADNTADYSVRFSQAPGQAYSVDTNGQSVTLASALTSAGGTLNKFGDGMLALTGANTYTGDTVIWRGTLLIGSSNALPAGSAVNVGASSGGISSSVFIGASTLDLGGFTLTASTVTLNGTVIHGTLSAAAFVMNAGSVSANLTGTGSLTVSGMGTLAGINTYTGPTTVASGTLSLAGGSIASGVILPDYQYQEPFAGSGGIVIISSGTLSSNITLNVLQSTSIGSLAGGAVTGRVALSNGATLTVGTDNTSTIFSGGIFGGVGGGSLTKVGAGTLTLAGDNTFVGPTTVSAGTLALAGNRSNNLSASATILIGAAGNLDVTGLFGGTLVLANNQTLAGSGAVSGKITATTGLAHLAPGGNGAVGTLTVGSLVLSDHLALDFDFASLATYDTLNVTALDGLSLLGGRFNLLNAGAATPFTGLGTFDLITFTGSLQDPTDILATLTASSILNAAAGLTYAFSVTGGDTLALTIDTRHHQWQADHFGSTAALAAQPAADPDHDGVPNLLEYALGTDPLAASTTSLPVAAATVSPADSLPHLTLTATLAAAAGDVSVDAEVSDDLVNWHAGTPFTEVVSDTTAGAVRTLVIRDTTPLGVGTKRFIRLRVSLP